MEARAGSKFDIAIALDTCQIMRQSQEGTGGLHGLLLVICKGGPVIAHS